MKVMSVVLFLALAAYIGLYIYNTANNPLRTTLAVRTVIEESGSSEGYIIRNETLLSAESGALTLVAVEGMKIGAGQAVAIYYKGETALKRASEIQTLQLEIKEAQAAENNASSLNALNMEDRVLALSDAVHHRNFDELEHLTFSLRNTLFSDGAGNITAEELASMNTRLNTLMAENTGTETIYAPMSGLFSSVVDGYEDYGSDILQDLTVSSLQSMFGAERQSGSAVLGKLITGITWYYAALMDQGDAQKLEGKNTATLQFTKTYNKKLEMTIERIGQAENGLWLVIFSARRSMAETTALRYLTADVEFNVLEGLRVPKEAVYFDEEGGQYVYLLTGLQAEKVSVEILCDDGDNYIVRDGAENGTVIREGSDIIVKGEDLYDGKVVEQ